MKLHAHDIVNFLRCRRKDYYGRIREWEVPTIGRPGEIGSMFHVACAAKDAKAAIKQYASQRIEEGILIPQEDLFLVEDMYALLSQTIEDNVEEVLSVEQELTLNVRDSEITCRPDRIFRDTSGVVHLRDYKTKDSIPTNYSWFDLDAQMMLYQIAARKQGWTPAQVEHLLVRREVPPGFGHRPEYVEGVDKNGRPYHKKSTASRHPSDYIKLFPFTKGEKTLQNFEGELEKIVAEMEGVPAPLRSPSPLCAYCPYMIPCIRDLGGDYVSDDEWTTFTKHEIMKGKNDVS